MVSPTYCQNGCPLFKCGARALRVLKGQKICVMTNEACVSRNCSYIVCVGNKLLTNGVCGKDLRRRTRPVRIEPDLPYLKLKGKLRNLKDDLY